MKKHKDKIGKSVTRKTKWKIKLLYKMNTKNRNEEKEKAEHSDK